MSAFKLTELHTLKAMCVSKGLPTTGGLLALRTRLRGSEHDKSNGSTSKASGKSPSADDVVVPIDYYKAVKEELEGLGIFNDQELHQEIIDRFMSEQKDSEAIDDDTYTMPELLDDKQREKLGLEFVRMNPADGMFTYKKVVPAKSAIAPAKPKAAPAKSMLAKAAPSPAPSNSIAKASVVKKPSPHALQAALAAAKDMSMPAKLATEASKPDMVFALEFCVNRLLKHANPAHVRALLSDFGTVPSVGSFRDYCETLGQQLHYESGEEDDE